MRRHQPDRLQSTSEQFSESRIQGPPSSSLWPPRTPSSDQHGRHPKRPTPGVPQTPEKDAEDAQKRRRRLLEMDDWTGAQAQKPLTMTFPSASPDAPVWGWSGEAEAESIINSSTNYRNGSRQESTSYSVKGTKRDSPRNSFPSSSSTMYARSSHQSRPHPSTPLRASFTAPASRSSTSSQPVSGTLSAGERERFESEGVGILSPSGAEAPAALRTPDDWLEDRAEDLLGELDSVGSQDSSGRQNSRESSMDRERTPSDIPEELILGGGSEPDDYPRGEEEEEAKGLKEPPEETDAGEIEGDAEDDVEEEVEEPSDVAESSTDLEMRDEEELEGEPTASSERDVPAGALQQFQQDFLGDSDDDDVQLVPLIGQQEELPQEEQAHEPPQILPQRQRTRRSRALGSKPAPMLARDTSTLSDASRAAALFEAQRVTIRDIPDYNGSDDPIEDSESELGMVRRAKSARTRGRGRAGRGRWRGQGRGQGRGARRMPDAR